MSGETETPFVVGAKVAIRDNYSGIKAGQIVKVYKNGNFILEVGGQQYRPTSWKPYGKDKIQWSAGATGSGYYRNRIEPWDSSIEDEIKAANKHRAHVSRCQAIEEVFSRKQALYRVDETLAREVFELLQKAIWTHHPIHNSTEK